MPMLLLLAIITSNTNTCRIMVLVLEVPVGTLPFRHPLMYRLLRDLVVVQVSAAVSRYQRQRQLA